MKLNSSSGAAITICGNHIGNWLLYEWDNCTF